MSSASRASTRLRSAGEVLAHTPDSKDARPLATAASTSASCADATRASSSPVAGLIDSKVSPDCAP
jgi:hypothetical protein